MRNIFACHSMRCCHGNGLNPKIDNKKISLVSIVTILGNLYRENFKINYLSFPFKLALYSEGVRKYCREPR